MRARCATPGWRMWDISRSTRRRVRLGSCRSAAPRPTCRLEGASSGSTR